MIYASWNYVNPDSGREMIQRISLQLHWWVIINWYVFMDKLIDILHLSFYILITLHAFRIPRMPNYRLCVSHKNTYISTLYCIIIHCQYKKKCTEKFKYIFIVIWRMICHNFKLGNSDCLSMNKTQGHMKVFFSAVSLLYLFDIFTLQ